MKWILVVVLVRGMAHYELGVYDTEAACVKAATQWHEASRRWEGRSQLDIHSAAMCMPRDHEHAAR